MKILKKDKDGGPESTVYAYWLIEWKSVFSIALLKFVGKSRECYHTHAFNSISWLLKGMLVEKFQLTQEEIDNNIYSKGKIYTPGWKPIITRKDTFHKVSSQGTSWVLTFRGPWDKNWKEYTDIDGLYFLTSGRIKVNENSDNRQVPEQK